MQIQFGKLGKVDYNPIDRAIDAYKTIVKNNIMSVKDYSKFAGLKSNEVNKRILEAELIIKFLEFANTNPDNYALAKQLDLDGPLQDMIPQYKKIKDSDNLDQLLNSLFAKIIQIRSSKEDFKDEFRQIVKNVVGTKNEEKFIEEMEDATDTIVEALDKEDVIRIMWIYLPHYKIIRMPYRLWQKFKRISTNHSEKAKNYKEQNKPVKLAEKAISSIEAIDKRIVIGLPKSEKAKLKSSFEKLKLKIDNLLSEEG